MIIWETNIYFKVIKLLKNMVLIKYLKIDNFIFRDKIIYLFN